MSTVAVPAYHFGILKGYLLGQNAPNDVLLAAEALHIAAVQGPLRDDALQAIRLMTEAAERLSSRVGTEPVYEMKKSETLAEEPAKPAGKAESDVTEFDLPPITKRALEMASKRDEMPSVAAESDDDKIEAFLDAKPVTRCPPAHAAGTDRETVVGESAPKKRKGWSLEAREAAAERMRFRQAAGLMKRGSGGVAPITTEEAAAPGNG